VNSSIAMKFGGASVKREIVGERDGGDHGVVGACRAFATCSSKPGGYPTEAAGCGCVERRRVEIGFGLLEVRLAGGAFLVGRCHEWTCREFGQGDGGDQWLLGERVGGLQATEQDERAGVENPARH
jgi:hypothetical protein